MQTETDVADYGTESSFPLVKEKKSLMYSTVFMFKDRPVVILVILSIAILMSLVTSLVL